jgi:hypothetical protein
VIVPKNSDSRPTILLERMLLKSLHRTLIRWAFRIQLYLSDMNQTTTPLFLDNSNIPEDLAPKAEVLEAEALEAKVPEAEAPQANAVLPPFPLSLPKLNTPCTENCRIF